MGSLTDSRVTYIHDNTATTLGQKRNLLVEKAKGEFIAHFDDDDYYAPEYVAYMLGRVIECGCDFAKLSAYLLFNMADRTYAYWDLQEKEGVHFAWSGGIIRLHRLTKADDLLLADNHLGFGFSYLYRRTIWEKEPFADLNWDEDRDFARRIDSRFPVLTFPDTAGLCLHVLHGNNTASCFPQFLIPEFLVKKLMPSAEPYINLLYDTQCRGD